MEEAYRSALYRVTQAKTLDEAHRIAATALQPVRVRRQTPSLVPRGLSREEWEAGYAPL